MIPAPDRVASPGRRAQRAQSRTGKNPQPELSWGDALQNQPAASAQNPQPAASNGGQMEDLLDFAFTAAQPSPSDGPWSVPNSAPAGASTQSQPQRAQDDMFGFFDMKTSEQPATTSNLRSAQSFSNGPRAGGPKKKKKKKKNKEGRGRSATVPARSDDAELQPPSNPAPPPPANELGDIAEEAPSGTRRRMKQINVLPLLHQGIRMYKFKFAGNGRAKQRTFFLTEDNKFLCWEAKGPEALAKAADDRQVYLGQIRAIQRNDPERVQQLSDVRHKQFTLSIVYVHKGGEKILNIMAFNAFHYQLIAEGLERLVGATNESGRDLADIFELYLNFDKDILPDHLKPQRFKWEALREDDIAQRERAQTVPAQQHEEVDIFIPTEGRERVSSF